MRKPGNQEEEKAFFLFLVSWLPHRSFFNVPSFYIREAARPSAGDDSSGVQPNDGRMGADQGNGS
jgi:hypothetical protein